jgi:two-component system response regulator CssR
MSFKVYLVEDNKELGELLVSYLLKEGWIVKLFNLGYEAIEAIAEKPHIWVLDIMLPDTDGFEIIKKVKEATPDVPVIFISARDQTLDRVLGLEMGSDDYIAKPFLPRELVIRVKRLLDRTYSNTQNNKGKLYVYCGYEIDEERRCVTQDGKEITLTSKETDLVIILAANAGRPFTRDALLSLVWDENYFGSDRVVDDLIRRIRKKLPNLNIETVYGQGYRLVV